MSERITAESESIQKTSTQVAPLDDLVEIQRASLAKVFGVSPAPIPPASSSLNLPPSQAPKDQRGKPAIEFLGQGKKLRLHQGVIDSPLVYVAHEIVSHVLVADRAHALPSV